MNVALALGHHWHTQLYLNAFAAAGAPISLVYACAEGAPPGLQCAETLSALLRERPDLVIVLGRPDEMIHLARELIPSGVALALEKPVGTGADQTAALAELVRQHGSFVAVAQPHLSTEFWQILPPQPGPLSHFRFRLVNGSPQRYTDWDVPWVLDRAQAGGGVLRNLGLHGISAFQQLTGSGAQVHSALLSSALYGLETEEYASVTLRSGQVIGQLEVGYTLGSDSGSEFELSAHWQHLSIRDDGTTLTIFDRRKGTLERRACLPLPRRYEHFARTTLYALAHHQAPVHDLAGHMQAMQIIDQTYAQATWIRP